jgi:hypothetical protein
VNQAAWLVSTPEEEETYARDIIAITICVPMTTRYECVHQMYWLACLNGKSFDAARSNEAAAENAVSTFAHRIMLNVSGLRGNQHKTWSRCASIRVFSGTEEKPA